LNYFIFEKVSVKIVQQSIKRILIARVAPLSVTTKKVVVENITHDPLAIASTGIHFTQESMKNMKNMMQDIEEYKERIRTLEEEM